MNASTLPATESPPQPPREPCAPARLVGSGRSGRVYVEADGTARKVFCGEGVTRAVLYLLTGAANPYTWCPAAVRTAAWRRKLVAGLVRYWFDDRLRIARTLGCGWNDELQAGEIRYRFVRGRHLPLQHRLGGRDLIGDLTRDIMRPLQRHLAEAGLDGLVWQAGRGNPTAGGNFLLVSEGPRPVWAWIDLESGVPALFPLNPLPLLTYYLPRSIAHRRPLFDDIDLPRLRGYLTDHADAIDDKLGPGSAAQLERLADRVESHQTEWKRLGRTERGLRYFVSQGRVTPAEADWYGDHPWRWQLRLLRQGLRSAATAAVDLSKSLARRLAPHKLFTAARNAGRFLASDRYRRRVARRFVMWRMHGWRRRGFLDSREARRLRRELRDDETALCVTDLGVHMAVKPLVKLTQWCVLPLLFALGLVSGPVVAIGWAVGGATVRTLYTLGRCLQATFRRERAPWIALGVGTLPVIGNAAYPIQLLAWSGTARRRLPAFLVYDAFAGFGRAVPIWGGADSLLEARLNRAASYVVRPATHASRQFAGATART